MDEEKEYETVATMVVSAYIMTKDKTAIYPQAMFSYYQIDIENCCEGIKKYYLRGYQDAKAGITLGIYDNYDEATYGLMTIMEKICENEHIYL